MPTTPTTAPVAEELAAIRERANAATEGPWVQASGDCRIGTKSPTFGDLNTVASCNRYWDREFIAAARTDVPRLLDLIDARAAQIAELTADNEQLNATFDLRYKADARAIKQWQEVTGKTISMPDHADLCVFLMMALDMSEARATTAEAALSAMTAERDEARRECLSARLIGEVRAEKAEEERAAALERERAMREALTIAYDLSTWAACINWRARNKDNQGEWLDELKELITRTQQLAEPLIKEQPAALPTKEAGNVR